MDQARAVDGVFAVVAGVVMTGRHINFSFAHEWIEAGIHIFELPCGVTRCVRVIAAGLRKQLLGHLERGSRHFRGIRMAARE